jgi:hypothetical protein
MSSDDSLSPGTHGFRAAGTGLAMTRDCMPVGTAFCIRPAQP